MVTPTTKIKPTEQNTVISPESDHDDLGGASFRSTGNRDALLEQVQQGLPSRDTAVNTANTAPDGDLLKALQFGEGLQAVTTYFSSNRALNASVREFENNMPQHVADLIKQAEEA